MSRLDSNRFRLGSAATALAVLGGCASFEFGGSSIEGASPAVSGASGTQVIATQWISAPADDWVGVLNNQSGQVLRLFVTSWSQGPLELRAAPAGMAGCAAATTLARRAEAWVLSLNNGCTLQARSRGAQPGMLRIQTEAPRLEP